jgi:hypothetical protein
MTTALGKMTDAGMTRSVLIYEGLHVAHRQETGKPYDGAHDVSTLSRIIALCKRFQDVLGDSGKSPSDVIATMALMADEREDAAIIRLMMAVLCVLPTGTLVQLSTDDYAQVLSVPDRPGDLGRPVVQLTDEDGEPLLRPVFIDLTQPHDGKPPPHIIRVVAMANEERVKSARGAVLVPPSSEVARPSGGFVTVKPERRQSGTTPQPIAPIHVSGDLMALAQRDDEILIPVGPIDLDALDAVPLPSIPPPPTMTAFDSQPPATEPQPSTQPDGGHGARHSIAPRVPADAEGSLAKTPLVNLLVYMLDRELTGNLLMHPDRGRAAIYFVNGAPCKVRTPELVSPLDETLVRMGKIDEATVTDTLRAVARTKQLHGRYLVENGFITEDDLSSALRQQLVNKVGHMFRYEPDTRYAYFDGVDLLSDYGGANLTTCEPLVLIMMGARKFVPNDTIDTVLMRLGNAPLALHQTADPRFLGLKPVEITVLDALEHDAPSFDALMAQGIADDDVVRRLLYALLITRHIDLSGGTRKPVGFKARTRV